MSTTHPSHESACCPTIPRGPLKTKSRESWRQRRSDRAGSEGPRCRTAAEKLWREHVHRGNDPQLKLRAIVRGMLIGVLMCLSNLGSLVRSGGVSIRRLFVSGLALWARRTTSVAAPSSSHRSSSRGLRHRRAPAPTVASAEASRSARSSPSRPASGSGPFPRHAGHALPRRGW